MGTNLLRDTFLKILQCIIENFRILIHLFRVWFLLCVCFIDFTSLPFLYYAESPPDGFKEKLKRSISTLHFRMVVQVPDTCTHTLSAVLKPAIYEKDLQALWD